MYQRSERKLFASRSTRLSRRTFLRLERLETRATPAGLSPAQIRHAYGFDQIAFTTALGQSIVGDGRGQTIAIVDAFHNPTVASDADMFDRAFSINGSQSLYTQYGPASQFLTVATPQGPPSYNAGWSEEIALDVEWAHAIAPGAHILLVEAKSDSLTDLLNAVDFARRQPTVAAVSMSWGTKEFRSETSYDAYFATPPGHSGVTFVAASGDFGAPGMWPAVSSNVVAVGGSTLRTDSVGNYVNESVWGGSGGGVSRYVSRPSYQSGVLASAVRGAPDVSYNANPSTGFTIVVGGRWETIGGTSAGAPQWAALVAIADQGRALTGKGSLDSIATLSALYNLPARDFHDVTSGSNGYSARPGYDLATGRGSPVANRVVSDLAGVALASTSGAAASSLSIGSSPTNVASGWGVWWFRGWFNPPFFGVAFGPMAASATTAEPAFAVNSQTSRPTARLMESVNMALPPIATSFVDSTRMATGAKPEALVFGNGVARLDWSDESDETEPDDPAI